MWCHGPVSSCEASVSDLILLVFIPSTSFTYATPRDSKRCLYISISAKLMQQQQAHLVHFMADTVIITINQSVNDSNDPMVLKKRKEKCKNMEPTSQGSIIPSKCTLGAQMDHHLIQPLHFFYAGSLASKPIHPIWKQIIAGCDENPYMGVLYVSINTKLVRSLASP